MIRWTPEQRDFILANYKGCPYKEMAAKLKEAFGIEVTARKIKAFYGNHHLNSGVNGTFKKGVPSWTKGKSFDWMRNSGNFQKGHRPHNYKPVGTERVTTEGYTEIKVADPHKWKPKHLMVWEEANGPLPQGFVVIFLNKDIRDIRLENLAMVSRSELARLNQNHLISEHPEITKSGINLSKLLQAIGRRKRAK